MTRREKVRVVAAYLHAAYLQGADRIDGPLPPRADVERAFAKVRKRIRSLWLADADAVLSDLEES